MRLALLLTPLLGCLSGSSATDCDDGWRCPAPLVCAPNGGCAEPAQVAACAALDDGAMCALPDGTTGLCVDRLCRSAGCGNGVLDTTEVCDDGNNQGGDGCSSDCQKIEACGDGVLDDGETCDDANDNPNDACDACALVTWVQTPILAGTPALSSSFARPLGLAVDGTGMPVVADIFAHRVVRVDTDSGAMTPIAGGLEEGDQGDGTAATLANLRRPYDVWIDRLGNTLIADGYNNKLRRIDARTGLIETIAGTGANEEPVGDGGLATEAVLRIPLSVVDDGAGNIYLTDSRRLRRIDGATGIITTLAGTETAGFNGDGPGATTWLNGPWGLSLDQVGNPVFADSGNHRIRRYRLDTGEVETVAGTGVAGFSGDDGDPLLTQFAGPADTLVDRAGNIYVADTDNHRVRVIAAGTVRTLLGDGLTSTPASIPFPAGLALRDETTLFVTTQTELLQVGLGASPTVVQVAGTDRSSLSEPQPRTSVPLRDPYGLARGPDGALYIADRSTLLVYRLDPATGAAEVIAGGGLDATNTAIGDGGLATDARLLNPTGLAFGPAGELYISEEVGDRVRKIDPVTGVITTIAGRSKTPGEVCPAADAVALGDGGPATEACLELPSALAVDADGNLYISDTLNNRVRRVSAVDQTITTVAGNGAGPMTSVIDGVPAVDAAIYRPRGLALDSQGRLWLADQLHYRIRKLDELGNITTAVGTLNGHVDGDVAVARLESPERIAFAPDGALLISDGAAHEGRVRRFDPVSQQVTTLYGRSCAAACPDVLSDGDAGPATAAMLDDVGDMLADSDGTLWLSETGASRVRRIDAASGLIETVVGLLEPAEFRDVPQALARGVTAMALTSAAGDDAWLALGDRGRLVAIHDGRIRAIAGRYPQTSPTGDLAYFRDENFGAVAGVAYDAATDRVYFTERDGNTIWALTVGAWPVSPLEAPRWAMTPLANLAGIAGRAGDNGPASDAQLRGPTGLYFDDVARVLYVADTGNHAIRAIDLGVPGTALKQATISTVAGILGQRGFDGDGGAAVLAYLNGPTAIAACAVADGVPHDLFVADTDNHRVRRLARSAAGADQPVGMAPMSTVLGDGVPSSAGEGAPATAFPVDSPTGVVCDGHGNLFVSSRTSIRQLAATDGVVDGAGPVRTIFGRAPREAYPESVLACLGGLAFDGTSVWIADACAGQVLRLTPTH